MAGGDAQRRVQRPPGGFAEGSLERANSEWRVSGNLAGKFRRAQRHSRRFDNAID